MDLHDRFRRVVERLLPWYDPATAKAIEERSDAIARRSIAARVRSERLRRDYLAMADRVERR